MTRTLFFNSVFLFLGSCVTVVGVSGNGCYLWTVMMHLFGTCRVRAHHLCGRAEWRGEVALERRRRAWALHDNTLIPGPRPGCPLREDATVFCDKTGNRKSAGSYIFLQRASLVPLAAVPTGTDTEVDQGRLNNFQGDNGKVKNNIIYTGDFTLCWVSLFTLPLYLDIDHCSLLQPATISFL